MYNPINHFMVICYHQQNVLQYLFKNEAGIVIIGPSKNKRWFKSYSHQKLSSVIKKQKIGLI